jgi:serine/threonine protein kinase
MNQLGGMDILELIGTGGYGRVYRVRAPSGAEYAAKVIDESHLEGRAVRRELRALTLLQERAPTHPALVPIRQVGREEGHLFYTMPLADPFGPSGRRYVPTVLRDCPRMSMPEALETARGLLAGLRALHEAGVVHRDLKPANILRLNECWAIGDFGLAVHVAQRTSEAGTVGFSPSSAGMGTSDDCFALGKILYCLLTGSRATQYPELNARLLNSGTRSEARRVIRFLNQACHPDPKRRFADAPAMETALNALLSPRRRRAVRANRVAMLALGTAITGLAIAGTAATHPRVASIQERVVWTDPTSGLEREYGLLTLSQPHSVGKGFPPAPAVFASLGWSLATVDSDAEFWWLYHVYGSRQDLWCRGDPTMPNGPRGIGPALAANWHGVTDDQLPKLVRFVNPRFDSPYPRLAWIDPSAQKLESRVIIVERLRSHP